MEKVVPLIPPRPERVPKVSILEPLREELNNRVGMGVHSRKPRTFIDVLELKIVRWRLDGSNPTSDEQVIAKSKLLRDAVDPRDLDWVKDFCISSGIPQLTEKVAANLIVNAFGSSLAQRI